MKSLARAKRTRNFVSGTLLCLLAWSFGQARVLVNGQVVIDQGKHTGARPGHVLYGPGRS